MIIHISVCTCAMLFVAQRRLPTVTLPFPPSRPPNMIDNPRYNCEFVVSVSAHISGLGHMANLLQHEALGMNVPSGQHLR